MANDLGKLILRLTLGVLMLLHGIAKIGAGTAGIEKMLASAALPGFFALGFTWARCSRPSSCCSVFTPASARR